MRECAAAPRWRSLARKAAAVSSCGALSGRAGDAAQRIASEDLTSGYRLAWGGIEGARDVRASGLEDEGWGRRLHAYA